MTDAQTRPAGVLQFPPAGHGATLTVADACDLYMAAYRGRDRTRPTYLAYWCELIGTLPLAALDADRVAEAMATFAREPARRYLGRDRSTNQPVWKPLGQRSPATLNRMRSALSALMRFAKRRRLVPRGWTNPVLEVEALREDNARTRFLSAQERERLLRAARASRWPKLHLLITMAITTGARRGELLGLTYGDLDLDAGVAYVRTSKNREPRTLPLTPAVVAEIRRLGVKGADVRLFASRYDPGRPMDFDSVWTTALRLAGIQNFRFHDLRHTCASYLAQSGASLVEIADVLGHKQLEVTRRYAHLTVDHKRQLVARVLGNIGEAA